MITLAMQCATVHSLENAHSHINDNPHTLPCTSTRTIGLKDLANGVLGRSMQCTLSEQSNVQTSYALVIHQWLIDIEEYDSGVIGDILHRCEESAETLAYFLSRASKRNRI